MGSELTKVSTGQPLRIKAATFNAFVDAARDYRERANRTASGLRRHDTKSGMLLVRNDTEEDQNQFAVLGLVDLVIKPADDEQEFRSRVVFSGMIPDKVRHRGRFCIYAEPVKKGEIGKAFVDDIAQVRLLVPEGVEETPFAEIDEGTTSHLKAASYGSATVLWREGEAGEQWAVVRIGKLPPIFPVKLATAGGAQGTDQDPATWAYNVYDPCTNELLLEAANPVVAPHNWKRPSAGWMIQATYGLARFNGQGEVVLTWINEMVEQEKCDDEDGGGGGGGGGTPTG